MQFTWDNAKDHSNQRKHGLDFETASMVFDDPFAWSEQDRIEDGEERWQTIGLIGGLLVVLVAHAYWREEDGEEVIRIISARRATNRERRRYEDEKRARLEGL